MWVEREELNNRESNVNLPANNKIQPRKTILHYAALAQVFCWSVAITISMIWNLSQHNREIIDIATYVARTHLEKDIVVREWNVLHEGVYVPVTEKHKPNPYLSPVIVPERDIVTPSGRFLTLVNPSYMTRQLSELAKERLHVQSHLMSLNPLSPENLADPWESKALQSFKHGSDEFFEIVKDGGQKHFKLIRPLITEQKCLKCHAQQGYVLGDIRGGISITFPMARFIAVGRNHQNTMIGGHLVLWVLGLLGIGLGFTKLRSHEIRSLKAEDKVIKAYSELEQIFHTVAGGMRIIDMDHNVLKVNKSFTELSGLSQQQNIEKKCFEVFSGPSCNTPKCPLAHIKEGAQRINYEIEKKRSDGTRVPCDLTALPFLSADGKLVGIIEDFRDITERKVVEEEREKVIRQLQKALDEIKTLRGIIPICSYCKKIRDDKGFWEQVDVYIYKHSDADISHSLCPECMEKHYPEEYREMYPKKK